METRKLQKLGASSYFITLPKDWIEKTGLKPGDRINVLEEDDGSLKILPTTHRRRPAKTLTIDVSKVKDSERLASTILTCGYILGFDVVEFINLKGVPSPLTERIEKILPMFMGMVTIDQTKTSVKTECVIDSSKIDPTSILKRMLSIVVDTVMKLTIKNLESKDEKESVPENIIVELMKLHNLIMRILVSERREREGTRYSVYFVAAALFEMIIDYMLAAAMASSRRDLGLDEEVVEEIKYFYAESSDAITDSILGLVTGSMQRARKAVERCKLLNSKALEVLERALDGAKTSRDKATISTILMKAADSIRISQVISNMAICNSMLEGSEWVEERLQG